MAKYQVNIWYITEADNKEQALQYASMHCDDDGSLDFKVDAEAIKIDEE